jgi:hypothetical protein
MKVDVIKITPEMAQKMLDKNIVNRVMSDRRIGSYAELMKNGDWSLTHQGVAFYEDGTLADGQQRLTGIIRAGVPVEMLVVRGLKKSQAIHIDTHRPRSKMDGIKIGGLNDWLTSKQIGMINLLSTPKRLSTEEILSFADDMEIHIKAASECFVSNRRHLNPSVVLGALMLAHFYGEKITKLRRFSEVLLSGVSESAEERVIILAREAFMRNTNNGESDKREKLLKLQKAIHSYCRGENVTRLFLPKESVYPYEELFNV